MADGVSELERQLNELSGALDLVFELREEFAQWVEEAADGSKREALENVLGQ
jgi:regulator of sigma D